MARMKVLLLQDLATLGQAGEVHNVAAGYARNYLMPQGIAMPATKGMMKQAEEIREAGIRRRAKERADAQAQVAVIEKQKLLFEVKAGETGRLYGSINTADLGDRLAELTDFEIDRRKIMLEQPIRDLGMYTVSMRLMMDVYAEFTVGVVQEGEGWAEAEAYKRAQNEAEAAVQAEADAAAAVVAANAAAEAAAEEAAAAAEAESAEPEAA